MILSNITDNYENILKNSGLNASIFILTIQNYHQILSVSSEQNYESIKQSISKIILQELGQSIFTEINSLDGTFFFLTSIIDCKLLETLSEKIHKNIVCMLTHQETPDCIMAASPVDAHDKIFSILNLLLATTKNTSHANIFIWHDSPNTCLKKIEDNYQCLSQLKQAVINKKANFAFQPIIKCANGEIAYHECLLRMSDHDHKLISAGPYIMLAEKYGFMPIIDKYVFDMAASELESTSDVKLSVNISNIGVQDSTLVRYISDLIEKKEIGPRMIIEITETAINENLIKTQYFVDSMKSLGCKIALDDFGVGYNSFSQIQSFEIDIIKIDGSFIRNITTNPKNKILVEAIIKISSELGCKTVAEFVENGLIAKELIELKVDYMQGNFFSPALNYRSWEKS